MENLASIKESLDCEQVAAPVVKRTCALQNFTRYSQSDASLKNRVQVFLYDILESMICAIEVLLIANDTFTKLD